MVVFQLVHARVSCDDGKQGKKRTELHCIPATQIAVSLQRGLAGCIGMSNVE